MMATPSDERTLSALDALESGVALINAANWRITWANQQFNKWFAAGEGYDLLSSRIPTIDLEKVRKRIDKGRPFSIDTEHREGPRTVSLRTTVRTLGQAGGEYLLAQTANLSKLREKESMLDSFSKLADRHKRELETVNHALTERTEELTRAHEVVKAQKDRMERELDVARQVQMSMLPSSINPVRDECTIAASLEPAREVGGDFFDFFFVDEERLCLVVADVSDKGAPAALFMAAAKTLLKSHASMAQSTAAVAGRVNRELASDNESCTFVTLFIAILNLATGEMVFTNAGHNPPYVVRRDRSVEKIAERNGPALGVLETAEYSENRTVVQPGDTFVAYTDGITEAMDPSGRILGEEPLEGVLASNSWDSSGDLVNAIIGVVNKHENGAPQSDDRTILVVQYHRRSSKPGSSKVADPAS